MQLNEFINSNKPKMLKELKSLVAVCKPDMRRHPELYKSTGEISPSVDIALWTNGCNGWQFLVGYDAAVSTVSKDCVKSSIGLNSRADELLDKMVLELLG